MAGLAGWKAPVGLHFGVYALCYGWTANMLDAQFILCCPVWLYGRQDALHALLSLIGDLDLSLLAVEQEPENTPYIPEGSYEQRHQKPIHSGTIYKSAIAVGQESIPGAGTLYHQRHDHRTDDCGYSGQHPATSCAPATTSHRRAKRLFGAAGAG
jgi:hypothetical protein